MTLEEIRMASEEANRLKAQYVRAYELGDDAEALKLERRYLDLRRRVIDAVTDTVEKKRAVPLAEIKRRVAAMPKRPKYETGIRSLDAELVTEEQKMRGDIGGFTLGNFIQIAGSRGAGKTSIMLKILTNISLREAVLWCDFEMGERRVVEKIKPFPHDDTRLHYYNSSRELGDIIDEIKLHYGGGARHFVIDSAMKIVVSGVRERYDRFSEISARLSELTSTLGINVYLINQMSQTAERDGVFAIKHGNDAEYDADYIFYVTKVKKIGPDGKLLRNEYDEVEFDEQVRRIVCTKNREDERLFSVLVPKSEIFGVTPYEITYED